MKHKPFDYQQTLIDNILAAYYNKEQMLKNVLGASCGAGKTFMGIAIAEALLKVDPKLRILILTHGQVVLRSQFVQDIENEAPDFTYTTVESSDMDEDVQVYVGLPQTVSKLKKNIKFDIILIDEAHQFFWTKDGMVQSIIKKSKPEFIVFLTGSISRFIKEGYKLHTISLLELLDAGRICAPIVELAKSRYVYTNSDFNISDDLKPSVNLTSRQTKDTLDDLLQSITKTLKSAARTAPALRNRIKIVGATWVTIFGSLGKTMFVCRSQAQARHVNAYFKAQRIDTALSTSEDDRVSEELRRFQTSPECIVGIVVNRGILGFNYPELVNMVDLSGTKNVDVLFQMFSRLVRLHPRGKDKLFLKVVPETMASSTWALMEFVMALSHPKIYNEYAGDYKRTRFPILREYKERVEETARNEGAARSLTFEELPSLPRFDVFRSLWTKEGELLSSFAYTTLNDVKSYFNMDFNLIKEEIAAYLKRKASNGNDR